MGSAKDRSCMKVVLVTRDVSIRGGTQKQVLRLAQDLRRRGALVQILAFAGNGKGYVEFGDFRLETCHGLQEARGGWLKRLSGEIISAWYLVSKIDSDTSILNVHDHGCMWVQMIAKLRHPLLKQVWQINDLHPAFHIGPLGNTKRRWCDPLHRVLCRLVAKFASRVTVNVSKNKSRVDACYRVNSDLFYPGVDQCVGEPLIRKCRRPLQLLSVGVFFPYRNYEAILSAMTILREQGLKSCLTLVGATNQSEEYAESIRSLAKEREMPVRIAGEVDDAEFKQIMLDSDLFVFANLDQSWGLAVFEAMSFSLPIVVSKSAGASELLSDGGGAVVVDARSPAEIASAVTRITRTPQEYGKFCQEAFATVSRMGWSATYCHKAWQLFSELLA